MHSHGCYASPSSLRLTGARQSDETRPRHPQLPSDDPYTIPMSRNEQDYRLISALRYDKEILLLAEWNTSRNCDKSPYLLLSYTVDRLVTAAEVHSWAVPSELTVDWLESRCDASLEGKDLNQPYKVLSKGIPRLCL